MKVVEPEKEIMYEGECYLCGTKVFDVGYREISRDLHPRNPYYVRCPNANPFNSCGNIRVSKQERVERADFSPIQIGEKINCLNADEKKTFFSFLNFLKKQW